MRRRSVIVPAAVISLSMTSAYAATLSYSGFSSSSRMMAVRSLSVIATYESSAARGSYIMPLYHT